MWHPLHTISRFVNYCENKTLIGVKEWFNIFTYLFIVCLCSSYPIWKMSLLTDVLFHLIFHGMSHLPKNFSSTLYFKCLHKYNNRLDDTQCTTPLSSFKHFKDMPIKQLLLLRTCYSNCCSFVCEYNTHKSE